MCSGHSIPISIIVTNVYGYLVLCIVPPNCNNCSRPHRSDYSWLYWLKEGRVGSRGHRRYTPYAKRESIRESSQSVCQRCVNNRTVIALSPTDINHNTMYYTIVGGGQGSGMNDLGNMQPMSRWCECDAIGTRVDERSADNVAGNNVFTFGWQAIGDIMIIKAL